MRNIAIAESKAARDEIARELSTVAKTIDVQAEALAGIFCDLADRKQLGDTGETLDGLIETLIDTAETLRNIRSDMIRLKL